MSTLRKRLESDEGAKLNWQRPKTTVEKQLYLNDPTPRLIELVIEYGCLPLSFSPLQLKRLFT